MLMSSFIDFIDNTCQLFSDTFFGGQTLAKPRPNSYMLDFAKAYVTAQFAYTLAAKNKLGALDTSVPINLSTPNQAPSNYQVTPLLNIPQGMHGFILSEIAPATDVTNIKICFRGVQLSELSSVKRALEFTGPGVNSFTKSADTIFQQIEHITKNHPKVNLEFTGHSLGGADALHAFHDFLSRHLKDDNFQNIEKVTLNTLNAPGDHVDTKTSLHQLLSENKQSDTPLKVEINISTSDNDLVSQIGQNPAVDLSPDLAKVQVCHVDKINVDPLSTWGQFFKLLPDIVKEMIYIAHKLESIFSPTLSDHATHISEQEFSPNFHHSFHNNQTLSGQEEIQAVLDYKWHTVHAINFLANCTNGVIALSEVLFQFSGYQNSLSFSDLYTDLQEGAKLIMPLFAAAPLSAPLFIESGVVGVISEHVSYFG